MLTAKENISFSIKLTTTGIAKTMDTAQPPNVIPQLVDWAAERYGSHIAIVDGRRVSFEELAIEVKIAAAAFIAAGIEKGDRVAIWAPNSYNWILACLSAQMVGAILVPLNTRLKGMEAQYILNKSRSRILITTESFLGINFLGLLTNLSLPHLEKAITFEESWPSFVAGAAEKDRLQLLSRRTTISASDPSDILFTSGTTGQPKGVLSSHGQTVRVFQAWSSQVSLNSADRYLIVNPFFHIFGYKAGWLTALITGCTVYPLALLDVAQLCRIIEEESITVLPGPPTLYQSILMADGLENYDISSLRLAITGAAVIPPSLIERMHTELGIDTVLTGYGLTEAGVVSLSSPADSAQKIAVSAGKPIPGTELKCLHQDGTTAPLGEDGEICVRGTQVMLCYFEEIAATAQAIDGDGWLHTGDVGYIDNGGYLHITDRVKDMYITGGFNCYPAEIERILCHHPSIEQAAVVGVADERLGEVGKAFLVKRRGACVSPEELKEWAKENMANYKVPCFYSFCDNLPINASGKVQKFLLTNTMGDVAIL